MKLLAALLMAPVLLAWECPVHNPPFTKIGETKNGDQVTVFCELDKVVYKIVVGPAGPQGVPGPVGPAGAQGPAYTPPKPAPIPWFGWIAINGATFTFSEDGSRVLIQCKTQGLCGFTHGLEGSMELKIRPSFDPKYGSSWFGIYADKKVSGILNTFSVIGWWKAATVSLPLSPKTDFFPFPRNDEYWMRAKDGTVDYSSDGVVWYPQTSATGDQIFVGCWNGGAFWITEIIQ